MKPQRAAKSRAWRSRSAWFSSRVIARGQRPSGKPGVARMCSIEDDHASWSSSIVVHWRAGLRIHEAVALTEADLDGRRGSVLVRRDKGGRRREGWQGVSEAGLQLARR